MQQEVQDKPQTVNWLDMRRGNDDARSKQGRKVSQNRKMCSKCYALFGQKLAKEMKTKASCSSAEPSLVQKPSVTV